MAGKKKNNDMAEGMEVSKTASIIMTIVFIILAVVFLFPIVLVLLNSFKSKLYISELPFAFPNGETFVGLSNYIDGLAKTGFFKAALNSAIITVLSVILIVVLTSMTAWWLTRVKSKFSSVLYYLFVFAMIVPFQMVMFTLSKVTDMLNLGNPIGIVIVYVGFGAGQAVFMFAGFVKCADCHRAMSKKTNNHSYGTYKYYRCVTSRKMDSGACTPHSIRIDKLEQAVLVTIQTMIDTALELDELIEKIDLKSKNIMQSNLLQKSLDKNIAERDKYKNMMVDLYPDWKSGTITKEEYMTLKEGISDRMKALDDKIAELQTSLENDSTGVTQENDFITHFKQYGKIEKLT